MSLTIAFDADDTLWHNESIFSMTQDRFYAMLTPYHPTETLSQKLYETEVRNLHLFGYGIKGFTISMIETAIELSQGQIRGHEIQKLIDFGKEMLQAPIDLLQDVAETIPNLAQSYRLMVITKGDLIDQESKIARSGLADYFDDIEIVSHKTPDTYQDILQRHNIDPQQFLMVGNSLKSDVLPVLAVGGQAVHIPYQKTWAHEQISASEQAKWQYFQLERLGQLSILLTRITSS